MTVAPIHIAYLVSYAAIMAIGNILLTYAARGISTDIVASAKVVLVSPYFWAGLAIYGLSVAIWLWLLSFIPLRFAYPIAATSLIFAPLFMAFLNGDWPSLRYWLGLLVTFTGLTIVSQS